MSKPVPSSTKGVGITATRPDPKAVLGPQVMREIARLGARILRSRIVTTPKRNR